MTINFTDNTIVMSKAESKAAGKFNSNKYQELAGIRAQFPTYRIVIKSAHVKKETYKGLTYDYMEAYIKAHATNDSVMKEFNTLRGYADGQKQKFVVAAPYSEIKKWFLMKFPEIKEYSKKVDELRKKTRKAAEAKKAS